MFQRRSTGIRKDCADERAFNFFFCLMQILEGLHQKPLCIPNPAIQQHLMTSGSSMTNSANASKIRHMSERRDIVVGIHGVFWPGCDCFKRHANNASGAELGVLQ